jgi:carbon starvation protein
LNGLILLVVSLAALALGYLFYGRYLARTWKIDVDRKTPALEFEDGNDYVPTSPSVVFGHQFASIAGAGPINGPIIAAMFGWLPVFLWLIFGSVFFGAVHDFAALYISVRNKGKSIGYCLELYVGKAGKRLFLLFVWLFSLLISAAFADIVAGTFDGYLDSGLPNKANGSVATASMLFIAVAVGLGFLIKKKKASGLASGIIAIDLLILCIVIGLFCPIYLEQGIWLYIIFAYVFIAAVAPIWVLEQPRNYLNSFLLIATMIAAFIGVIFTVPEITLPAFTGFEVNGAYLFPTLFITIACGAISGFHSMVSTEVTSKQISNEKYLLRISYGAMLLETLLAVLALIAVGSLAVGGKLPQDTPPVIFATAVSGFLYKIGFPPAASYVIVALAVSAFVLTTLDTVTRLGRIAFQELFTEDKQNALMKVMSNKIVSALFTLIFAYLLAVAGYGNIWPLFGAANQLLAVLSLIACAVFLKKTRRKGAMLVLPVCFMLAVTVTSLIFTIKDKFINIRGGSRIAADGLQLVFGSLLLVLAVILVIACAVKIFGREKRGTSESGGMV